MVSWFVYGWKKAWFNDGWMVWSHFNGVDLYNDGLLVAICYYGPWEKYHGQHTKQVGVQWGYTRLKPTQWIHWIWLNRWTEYFNLKKDIDWWLAHQTRKPKQTMSNISIMSHCHMNKNPRMMMGQMACQMVVQPCLQKRGSGLGQTITTSSTRIPVILSTGIAQGFGNKPRHASINQLVYPSNQTLIKH